MQSFSNTIFKGLIRETIRAKPKVYANGKGIIQSSVGLIFKLHSDQKINSVESILQSQYNNIELLFTQRAGFQKDINKYNIVFPGGQCDDKESDFQACKRQLEEQVRLKVDQQCIYIGQLPKNFYYLQKRGSKLFITCHIWCLKNECLQWKQTLNSQQLRASKWVSMDDLLKDSKYIESNEVKLGIIERMSMKYKYRIFQSIKQMITNVRLPELDLGMDRNLWGLTLWIWSYALQMAYVNVVEEKKGLKVEERGDIEKWINHCKKLQIQFKPRYLLKYPIIGVAKYWHRKNRIQPFTYSRSPPNPTKAYILIILTIFLLYYTLIH